MSPDENEEGFATGNRHVSNLELFVDLVFVFAVTQVVSFVARDLDAATVGKALLLAWLAWWQWTAFTWAGTAVDLEGDARKRIMVLCMIPAALVMAITLPQALTTQGLWFASAYWLVQVCILAMQGVDAMAEPSTRRAFLAYAPFAAVAPTVLLAGALFEDTARLVMWIGAVALFVVSALLGGRSTAEWSIDPVHFVERHSLFVIISLGEILVSIGANAAEIAEGDGLDGTSLAAVIAAVAVACVLWWAYFAYVPKVVEHALSRSGSRGRGSVARDLFSFGHFPIVCGLIANAVVAKHLVQHPDGPLAAPDRLMMLGSVVLFVGGLMNLQWRVSRSVSWVRVSTIAAAAALAAVGGLISGVVAVALNAVLLLAMATLSWHRFQRSDIGRTLLPG